MRQATQTSNEEKGEFRPNLAGQKRVQNDFAEGRKKKVAVQKGPCEQFFFRAGHPLLLTLGSGGRKPEPWQEKTRAPGVENQNLGRKKPELPG